MSRRQERQELAAELVDDLELLVRQAENAVEVATGHATLRDIAETRLRECIALQDEVLEATAPVLAQREREAAEEARRALEALHRVPLADWALRHRRAHSVAVKARLVRIMGGKAYVRLFPW